VRFLRLIAAFLRKDLLEEASYRTAFLMQFGGIFISVTLWFLIARYLRPAESALPDLPGVPYFAYLLIGIAFYHYLASALGSFATKLRNEQLTGTLEAMLITPTPIPVIILSSALWDFLMTSLRVMAYLGMGLLFFGLQLRYDSLLAFFLILFLTILAFSGIGILSAAFILYLKRGDPLNFLISSVSGLFGGVFFPTQTMPYGLGAVGKFLPITYALNGIRKSLLVGTRLGDLLPEIAALLLFIVILLPLGLAGFSLAVRRAREEGTLAQY